MIDNNSFPELGNLFGAYLNQDYDLSGDTIEEVVLCFKNDCSPQQIENTLEEIERYKEEAGDELEKIFEEMYGYEFSPKLWGCTAASFFDDLKRILSSR